MFLNRINLAVILFSAFAAVNLCAMKRAAEESPLFEEKPAKKHKNNSPTTNIDRMFADLGQRTTDKPKQYFRKPKPTDGIFDENQANQPVPQVQIIEQFEPTEQEINDFYNHIKNNKIELVEAALKKGLNLNTLNHASHGQPLFHAVDYNQKDITELFIKNGVNINKKCPDTGRTALYDVKDIEIAALLLDNGANVNTQAITGKTPLMCIAEQGNVQIVQQFIIHRANTEIKDNKGFDALNYASGNYVPNGKTLKKILGNKQTICFANAFLTIMDQQINGANK